MTPATKYCIDSKTNIPGCGEAAFCCESAEQEGEAETAKGNNIQVLFFCEIFLQCLQWPLLPSILQILLLQVPLTAPSHPFLLVITLGKGM